MRIYSGLLAICILMALLTVGCAAGGGPVEATVTLNDFAFEPDGLTVPSGAEINLTIINNGAEPHNFIVMNAGIEVTGSWTILDRANVFFEPSSIAADETITVTFTAPSQAGEYQILCSIPPHLARGMRGLLTVTD